MSDLAPLVSAAIRDKVVLDQQQEIEDLRKAKEELQAAKTRGLVRVTGPSGSPVYAEGKFDWQNPDGGNVQMPDAFPPGALADGETVVLAGWSVELTPMSSLDTEFAGAAGTAPRADLPTDDLGEVLLYPLASGIEVHLFRGTDTPNSGGAVAGASDWEDPIRMEGVTPVVWEMKAAEHGLPMACDDMSLLLRCEGPLQHISNWKFSRCCFGFSERCTGEQVFGEGTPFSRR